MQKREYSFVCLDNNNIATLENDKRFCCLAEKEKKQWQKQKHEEELLQI